MLLGGSVPRVQLMLFPQLMLLLLCMCHAGFALFRVNTTGTQAPQSQFNRAASNRRSATLSPGLNNPHRGSIRNSWVGEVNARRGGLGNAPGTRSLVMQTSQVDLQGEDKFTQTGEMNQHGQQQRFNQMAPIPEQGTNQNQPMGMQNSFRNNLTPTRVPTVSYSPNYGPPREYFPNEALKLLQGAVMHGSGRRNYQASSNFSPGEALWSRVETANTESSPATSSPSNMMGSSNGPSNQGSGNSNNAPSNMNGRPSGNNNFGPRHNSMQGNPNFQNRPFNSFHCDRILYEQSDALRYEILGLKQKLLQLLLNMIRIDENELSRQPHEVLEIISKLGEGSFGIVYKARVKADNSIVAVKKVPVDNDLLDIVKEISIMQQCDNQHIVKCYGSMYDNQDLWICMEYCGAGSVADIMRLREKPLNEDEIMTILKFSLLGLEYMHERRKIHRDIKADNILLMDNGCVKLADFGVSAQLSNGVAKRNTFTGSPFWMAPEIIQKTGYNCSADIWSLGITAIEMADAEPPLVDMGKYMAFLMIPNKPPPQLKQPSMWSEHFLNLIQMCLSKTPKDRPTATELLRTECLASAKSCSSLIPLINDAQSELRNPDKRDRISAEVESIVSRTTSDQDRELCETLTSSSSSASKRQSSMIIISGDDTMLINSSFSEEGDDLNAERILQQVKANGTLTHKRNEASESGLWGKARPHHLFDNSFHSGAFNEMSYSELVAELARIDRDLDKELESLNIHYKLKRQPLVDALTPKLLLASHKQQTEPVSADS